APRQARGASATAGARLPRATQRELCTGRAVERRPDRAVVGGGLDAVRARQLAGQVPLRARGALVRRPGPAAGPAGAPALTHATVRWLRDPVPGCDRCP